MVTEEDIRRVALSLPGSVEKPYNRLPSFRVRGTLFLRIHELPDAFFVRCADLEERDELLKADPGTFFITPHYDGYPAALVRLSRIDLDEMICRQLAGWQVGRGIAACLAVQALRPAAVQVVPPWSAAPADRRTCRPPAGHRTAHRIRGWPGWGRPAAASPSRRDGAAGRHHRTWNSLAAMPLKFGGLPSGLVTT